MSLPPAIPSSIPADDRGFTLGDGLFETVLSVNGGLVRAEAHIARLTSACTTLGLPAPEGWEAERVMAQAARSLEGARGAVRLTLTAGSGGRGLDRPAAPRLRMVATAAPSPRPVTPARLATARRVRRNALSPASRLKKTLSYLDNVLAREEARAADADEAVMLNTEGLVACAAAANLFWISGATIFTPALDCGVLPGTMRAHLMAQAGVVVREVAAAPEALAEADAVFLTNALIGVRPVAELDGQPFPADHPLLARLAALVGD